MAHFIGMVQGQRGEASRLGTRSSSMDTTAASWQGSVRVYLYYDDSTGKDMVRVRLAPWHGSGVDHIIYEGPVGEYAPTREYA